MSEERSELAIEPTISRRYSPRAFRDEPLAAGQFDLLFEAARWASSSRNEQPWRFVVARRGTPEFDRLVGTLSPTNAIWAQHGAALVLVLARRTFTRDGSVNVHAWHDVGLAIGNLSVQATAMGLGLHQMGGFDAGKAREAFLVPVLFDVVTVVVLGWPGAPDDLPDQLRERERVRSQRRPMEQLVFEGRTPQE